MIYDEPADKVVAPIRASLKVAGASHVRDAEAAGAFAVIAQFG